MLRLTCLTMLAALGVEAPAVGTAADAPRAVATVPPAAPRATDQGIENRKAEDPLLAADLALLARLDAPFDAPRRFKDSSAREVLDAVRATTGIEVELDRRAVGDSGGWEFVRLDCDARTPREALDAVAAAISDDVRALGVDVAAGLLMLADASNEARLAVVRHYDMRSILLRRDRRDRDTQDILEEVAALVRESVNPEGWKENGGDSASLRILDSSFVVLASPARHHAITRFLAGLEAALPSPTILWRLRIVEIAAEVPRQDLQTVLGSGAELDTLIEMKGARVVAAPTILANRAEPADATIADESGSLTARIAPIAGSTAFACTATEVRDGQARSISLRVLEGVRAAALIEGGGRRLLVEATAGAAGDESR